MRLFVFLTGLWTLLCFRDQVLGQSASSTHALGLYAEPPLPGWILGQDYWPALQPLGPGGFGFCMGLRHLPYLPGQGFLTLGLGYQKNRDWLTLRLRRNGWWEFGSFQSSLGLSRGVQDHRFGMNLSIDWSPKERNPAVAFGLGSEHRLATGWRCGFRIRHATRDLKSATPTVPAWQSGLHFTWQQNALNGSLRLHFMPGRLPVSEWVLGYQPNSRWSYWLVSDPWSGIIGVGLSYQDTKHRWTLSSVRTDLPVPVLRSTFHRL
jgi:hypothetical protein